MSETTIQVPAEHLEAVRQGLIGRRDDPGQRAGVESLLGQIERASPGPAAEPRRLTGSRVLLWSAVYDSLCVAAEQLAEECNEYWRGTVAPDAVRGTAASVGARLDLLVALGAPPVG
jgi:hypothetical protein